MDFEKRNEVLIFIYLYVLVFSILLTGAGIILVLELHYFGGFRVFFVFFLALTLFVVMRILSSKITWLIDMLLNDLKKLDKEFFEDTSYDMTLKLRELIKHYEAKSKGRRESKNE